MDLGLPARHCGPARTEVMSPEWSEEILRRASAACFWNAESHRGAARILFEEDFRAQALALAAIGIEEFAKSILYAVAALVPDQRTDLPAKIDRHLEKQIVALSAEVEDIILTQRLGRGGTAQERLAECLTRLARSGIGKLRSLPSGSDRQEFKALFEAMLRKDAGLYVDVDIDGHVLLPERVEDDAADEINGLEWFLDAYGALPAAVADD